jgi:uncharacterized protein YpmB
MTIVGLILSRYWKPLMLLFLIVAFFIYRGILVRECNEARSQAAQLATENASLHATNQALAAEIARQNAAVAQLKTEADRAVNTMAADESAAVAAGLAAQNAAQQQAGALSSATISAGSGCDGAIQWGNAEAAELATW